MAGKITIGALTSATNPSSTEALTHHARPSAAFTPATTAPNMNSDSSASKLAERAACSNRN